MKLKNKKNNIFKECSRKDCMTEKSESHAAHTVLCAVKEREHTQF